MGLAHIAFIYEDSIDEARHDPESWSRLRSELGEALLTLCLKQPLNPWGITRKRSPAFLSHPVGTHFNGANVCDEVHSSDERVFVWYANALKALDKATDEELALAGELIAAERRRRLQAL